MRIDLSDNDFFLAKGKIREFRKGLIVPEGQDPTFAQYREEEVSMIPLTGDFSKRLRLVPSYPMVAALAPDQKVPLRVKSEECLFFEDQVNGNESLFDFALRNEKYLSEHLINNVHELQHFMSKHRVWYLIQEIDS